MGSIFGGEQSVHQKETGNVSLMEIPQYVSPVSSPSLAHLLMKSQPGIWKTSEAGVDRRLHKENRKKTQEIQSTVKTKASQDMLTIIPQNHKIFGKSTEQPQCHKATINQP